MSLVQQTHQYVGAPAGADRGAGQRVKGSAAVKVFTAQVVWTIAQSAAYGAALIPAIKKKTHTHAIFQTVETHWKMFKQSEVRQTDGKKPHQHKQ